ncbi:CPBP family intramembrane glutamic endopeptidase [Streptosporangium lutulentum]|uniref:Membrane protease YdiL (CAAX protease family) n=1 Tax=Streptosporangium lutulentum TaxID=1461250 RepID=A0ABT9QKY1_9ACTN|nr:type II CAAX endopeptidase family protein [Streptosporangium lutulentum]MDP9847041.1 membrane protease YdiL (CAAX protease family) [Streptosporangium lutulentum]
MPDPPTPPAPRLALLWRILIVFAATVLLWLFVYRGIPLGHDYDRLTHAVRAVLTTVLVVPMVVAARRLLDRRPWTGLGLPSLRTGRRRLLLGMACWFVPAAIGFALCLGFGWVEISLRTSVADALQVAALLVVLVFLYEALPEELVFRGYLQRNLVTALPAWQTVIAQAALFTLFGFLVGAAGSLDRLLIFFFFALVLGGLRVATGDIWAGIGFHLAFQTVAQLFDGAGAVFDVTGFDVLGIVALGALPFSLGWMAVERLYRERLNWQALEPDPAR